MNNIIHLVTGKLNTVDMAYPGETTVSDIGTSRFKGQAGITTELRREQALELSDTSVGTLYGGTYQLVQTVAGSTVAPARGLACFWSDLANFVVTPDVPTQPGGTFAGVYISAPTKGNWCIIQTKGIATVLTGTVTETVVNGDTLFVTSSSGGKFNNLADATAINAGNANDIAGRFQAVIASDSLGLASIENAVANV